MNKSEGKIKIFLGSIWINFSFPTILGQPLYFPGYLIVQAIQMGANIDYAIVISSHYQERKACMPHKEAIVHALNAAFPTVFTSGTILIAIAGAVLLPAVLLLILYKEKHLKKKASK